MVLSCLQLGKLCRGVVVQHSEVLGYLRYLLQVIYNEKDKYLGKQQIGALAFIVLSIGSKIY